MKSVLAKLFFGGLPTDDWLVVAAVQDDIGQGSSLGVTPTTGGRETHLFKVINNKMLFLSNSRPPFLDQPGCRHLVKEALRLLLKAWSH